MGFGMPGVANTLNYSIKFVLGDPASTKVMTNGAKDLVKGFIGKQALFDE
ncbi:MAG TPA: hypothetical protein VMG59_11810 [Phycisphaerae bacterium]|nr:hypothetical protein [Phycisphaerae bacterium]